jgi:tetratricopeptide (TPR) repeat protein
LPVAGRIALGVWEFHEAAAIAIICFVAAVYLYIKGRRRLVTLPDGAAMIDRARKLEESGKAPKALAVLTEALSLDPKLWQALEYRARLHLSRGDYSKALDDLSEAIRVAPEERHLYLLRAEVYRLIGQEGPALDDCETASRLARGPV